MMIRAIKSAFPARAIKIAKPERSAIGLSVILTFLFILISMSLFWLGNSTKADIVYDQEIAKDAEPFEPFSPRGNAAHYQSDDAIQGKCNTRVILTHCKITIKDTHLNVRGNTRTYDIAFIDFSFGNYSVTPVRSASKPDMISVDLAINHITDRIILMWLTYLVGIIFIALGPFLIFSNVKLRNNIKRLSQQVSQPVIVEILSRHVAYGNKTITYRIPGSKKKFKSIFVKGEPLMLDNQHALAITAEGLAFVWIIDEHLKRLDLSEAERQNILQACQKTQPVNA